jgi:hypothetical protein
MTSIVADALRRSIPMVTPMRLKTDFVAALSAAT